MQVGFHSAPCRDTHPTSAPTLLCSMLFELLVNLQTCSIQVMPWIITCRCGSCCRMAQLGAALSPWLQGTSRDLLARPTRTPRQLQQQLRLSWPSQAEGASILRPSVVPCRSSSCHHAVCPCAALECSHLSPCPLQSGSVHILLCPTSAEWRLISPRSHDTNMHSGWDLFISASTMQCVTCKPADLVPRFHTPHCMRS